MGDDGYPNPLARDAARVFWEEITVRSPSLGEVMMPGKDALTSYLPVQLSLALADPDLFPFLTGIQREVEGLIFAMRKLVAGEERLSMAEQDLIIRGPEIIEKIEGVHIEERKAEVKQVQEHLEMESEEMYEVLSGQASLIAWFAELRHGLGGIARAINQERETRGPRFSRGQP